MPRYLVAIHHLDDYDPSLEDEAMYREIDVLKRPLRGSVREPGWVNAKQPVVEQLNLAPVRGCRGGTPGVNGPMAACRV